MEIRSTSCFPLLASDQADVIRIFLELMCENNRVESMCDVRTINNSLDPLNNNDAYFLGGLLDLG